MRNGEMQYEDMPADGCIVVKRWNASRSQGFHVEKVETVGEAVDYVQVVSVIATPLNISTGAPNGEPRRVALRFGLDSITVLPGGVR